ncbi:MAG: ion transporter [Thermoleophilia bacterium]|nr:ion transporter [Thermoleophilia bacterium]
MPRPTTDERKQAYTVSHGDILNSNYEAFILAISILSVVNGVSILFAAGQQRDLLVYVNAGLCVLFALDFLYRLRKAPQRRAYLFGGGGMLDLLSSIPVPWYFSLARLLRVVRATRLLNRYGERRLRVWFRERLAEGAVLLVMFLVIVTLEVGGILVLWAEAGQPGANIETGGDALWWGYVTITSVGYGDMYPVTPQGRIVGVVMLTVGLLLLATVTGFVANAFLSKHSSGLGRVAAAEPSEPPLVDTPERDGVSSETEAER